MDVNEEYQESSDESMAMDSQMGNRLPSNISTEDYYSYKKFVNLPESQAEFVNKIDKDIVFANLSGRLPNAEELAFQLGTIILFESEFVEELQVARKDVNGYLMKDKDGKIIFDTVTRFDEAFRGCLDFLKGEYKYAHVASRALGGHDRAGVLDVTSASRISKEFGKKKEKNNSLVGTGGI
jgi:hypothetical protein